MTTRPDAATWAKELCNAFGLRRWDDADEQRQRAWLAVAEKALTLHAQAVAQAVREEIAKCPKHS
jgi:hypothetical protein